jgi:transposase
VAKAYSDDFRDRALVLMDRGEKIGFLSVFLDISISTLKYWRAAWRKEGRRTAKTGYQKGHSHKITDIKALEKTMREHPDKTLAEIGQLLDVSCGRETVRCCLKKHKITYKKKSSITSKEIPKSAPIF